MLIESRQSSVRLVEVQPQTTLHKRSPLHPVNTMRSSILITAAALAATVSAGPLGYAVCQAGCASVVMACYAAGGATWGATLGATAPATIVACNAAYGTCQTACAAVLLIPFL
ncbi:hypothetical protein Vi05172_g1982 [Venturia inaequalis]|nr:hypothetical protein Vi05172_g1982 [Venturia inaequalis]